MANIIERTRTWLLGKKPDPGLLKAEISGADLTGIRQIDSTFNIAGMTPPELAVLLREAETGDASAYLDLAEQMEERDLHYLGVLSKRKRQVSQLPITVDAATDSPADVKAADFVREWLTRDTLETELFDVLDAIGKGYSGSEIIWDMEGSLWRPAQLKYRLPRWFAFDRKTGEIPLLRGGYEGAPAIADDSWRGVPLPPGKFLFHLHPAKSGLPIRGGLARPVAWAYLFKNFALKDWLAFAEIYGRPFRIGKYPAGTTEDQIRELLRAVAGMGEDAAAVIADGMSIDLVDSKATGADVYDRLAQYLDRQVSKAVLGETATTDADTGGLGSGKEHGDVREDIERADAKLLSASTTRDVITPMVRLNYGPGVGVPKLKIGREEAWDATTMMPAVRTFVELGGRVEMSVIADKLGLPDAPKGDHVELLRAPAAPGIRGQEDSGRPAEEPDPEKTPVSARKGANAPEMPEAAATRFLGGSYRPYSHGLGGGALADVVAAAVAERVAERLGSDPEAEIASYLTDDWNEILSPMVDPLVAAMQRATSYEEAIAALTAGLDAMDTGPLQDAVARGSLVARGKALEEGGL